MSPFIRLTDVLSAEIDSLDLDGQVALFLSAARAHRQSWQRWAGLSGEVTHLGLFDLATSQVASSLFGGVTPPPELLYRLEQATPDNSHNQEGFTAAQDVWIWLDTALRGCLGQFSPAASTWYLLEPLFQAESERLFGTPDVGAENEEFAENVIVEGSAVAMAVDGLKSAIFRLSEGGVRRQVLAEVEVDLAALLPAAGRSHGRSPEG